MMLESLEIRYRYWCCYATEAGPAERAHWGVRVGGV